MSAPLTTRDALAEALTGHEPWGGGHFCSCTPIRDDYQEPLGCSWEQHLADALLASGALIDATKLADHLGFICDEWVTTQASRPEAHGVARGMAAEIRTALAAVLSAQSERAEVER